VDNSADFGANVFARRGTARVSVSDVFNKLGLERCKSILDHNMANMDLDHSPIYKV